MLDASRSSLQAGPPQYQLVTFRPFNGDGFFAVEDTTYPDGSRAVVQYFVQPDGREFPVNGAARIVAADADTLSLTRVNEASWKWTYRKGPAVTLTAVGEVSPDGSVFTLTTDDDRRLVYLKTS